MNEAKYKVGKFNFRLILSDYFGVRSLADAKNVSVGRQFNLYKRINDEYN